MTITIKIHCVTAAFDRESVAGEYAIESELVRILSDLADGIYKNGLGRYVQDLRDINGNVVGTLTVKE